MKVQNNLLASRYELYMDGELSMTLSYHMESGQMWMLSLDATDPGDFKKHTEVFLQDVFKDVLRRRLEVLPFSPKARAFVVGNEAYLRLIPKTTPGHFPDLRLAAAVENHRRAKLKTNGRRKAVASQLTDARNGQGAEGADRSMSGKKRASWFQSGSALPSMNQRRLHPSYGSLA